mmetsp:Transcript_101850/g.263225  ORF Transcript_101850/g.263225 Transcript_101850/m.263225 type:complete len:276 (+) Transcript_101850:1060-1887(+)
MLRHAVVHGTWSAGRGLHRHRVDARPALRSFRPALLIHGLQAHGVVAALLEALLGLDGRAPVRHARGPASTATFVEVHAIPRGNGLRVSRRCLAPGDAAQRDARRRVVEGHEDLPLLHGPKCQAHADVALVVLKVLAAGALEVHLAIASVQESPILRGTLAVGDVRGASRVCEEHAPVALDVDLVPRGHRQDGPRLLDAGTVVEAKRGPEQGSHNSAEVLAVLQVRVLRDALQEDACVCGAAHDRWRRCGYRRHLLGQRPIVNHGQGVCLDRGRA